SWDYNKSYKLKFIIVPLAFLCGQRDLNILQRSQELLQMFLMLFQGLRIDEDVIKVGHAKDV
nr:hypothetical protein [Shewanella shenzhenensis]